MTLPPSLVSARALSVAGPPRSSSPGGGAWASRIPALAGERDTAPAPGVVPAARPPAPADAGALAAAIIAARLIPASAATERNAGRCRIRALSARSQLVTGLIRDARWFVTDVFIAVPFQSCAVLNRPRTSSVLTRVIRGKGRGSHMGRPPHVGTPPLFPALMKPFFK